MIQGLLFDWDGVISDSFQNYYELCKHCCQKFGKNFTFSDLEDFRQRIPETFPETFMKMGFSDAELEEAYAEHKNFTPHKNVPLCHGIKDALNETNGLKLGIVSSNFKDVIEKSLVANGLLNRFSVIIGYDNTLKIKPSPEMLLKASNNIMIQPKNIVYVGDSRIDIIAAKAAGMKSIAATWGYASQNRLEKENPDFIVNNPQEILKIVNEFNGE